MSLVAGTTIFLVLLFIFNYSFKLPNSKNQDNRNVSPVSSENFTETIQATPDYRVLLSFENIRKYNQWTSENCQEDFNTSPANQWVDYSNSQLGIKFKVPYNSLWGNSRFQINPYDEFKGSIWFGPFLIGEACSWYRSYSFTSTPHISVDLALNEIGSDLTTKQSANLITINGLYVITYSPIIDDAVGGCAWPILRVSGKKFDYLFSSSCSQNEEEDFKIFKEVVQTIEIVN